MCAIFCGVVTGNPIDTVDAMMSRTTPAIAALGLAIVFASQPGPAIAAPAAQAHRYPHSIALPAGFRPEGIATGSLPYAYLGSLADGSIYRADLVTGEGRIISVGPGSPSVGLKLDGRGRLFVAGGATGDARVVDVHTGEVLASYVLATGDTFVNDVTLTRDAAWFTDSRNAVLYRLPFGRHGELPPSSGVDRLPLGGEWEQVEGFNANGVSGTPDGRALLVVHSTSGVLYRVDPATGAATRVDLGGESLTNGDGLLLIGRTLYAVRNRLNEVVAITLNRAGTAGTVAARLTDETFDVPTTVAAWGGRLYLPNARFGIADPASAAFTVTAIDAPYIHR